MSRSGRILTVALTALALWLNHSSALAQAKPLQFHDLQGKVVAISGNIIQWTDPTKAEMYVRLDNKTRSLVTGEVEPSFLSPGTFVRFPAEVTKRGRITGEVREMTVFSPLDGYSAGVFADGAADPKAASARYLISGQIESVKNGQMIVRAGEQSFKFKLAEDAELKIEVSDLSIVRPDDEISITGSGERKDQIQAREIAIKLAKPLAGAEKNPRKSSAAKKPARKSDRSKAVDSEDPGKS